LSIVIRWENEGSYRAALNRIADSPDTRVVIRREFDDSYHVLYVLISARLHELLAAQLATLPEDVRNAAFKGARDRMGEMDTRLLKRFAGCDATNSLLIDKIDIGFEGTVPVVAVVSMFSDRLLICGVDEVPLGVGFAEERDKIQASLQKVITLDVHRSGEIPGQLMLPEIIFRRTEPKIQTPFYDLRIAIQTISEAESIRLSNDACVILDGYIRGVALERLEFQIQEILVNAETALSQLPKDGSFIEWALHHQVIWASPFSQLEFVVALAKNVSFERSHAAHELALGIHATEVRLLLKLGSLDRFPSGLAAQMPRSGSLFKRLQPDFVKRLSEFTTGDIAMASLLAHPVDANTRGWQKRLVGLLGKELKNGATMEGSREGVNVIQSWAKVDPIASLFARLFDPGATYTDWKGMVEGYRRFQGLHPKRGWARKSR
jgi:hypothetical protein